MLELTPQELANQLKIVGHGAIPFGVANGLQNADGNAIPSVEYFAR